MSKHNESLSTSAAPPAEEVQAPRTLWDRHGGTLIALGFTLSLLLLLALNMH